MATLVCQSVAKPTAGLNSDEIEVSIKGPISGPLLDRSLSTWGNHGGIEGILQNSAWRTIYEQLTNRWITAKIEHCATVLKVINGRFVIARPWHGVGSTGAQSGLDGSGIIGMPTDDETQHDAGRSINDRPSERADTPNAPSLYDLTEAVEFELNSQLSLMRLPCQLGDYLLTEQVGQGGAGIVFRATSSKHPSAVAVKVLRPEVMANSTAVRRFAKEARLHGEIDNPYVTRLIEFGSHKGLYYMVSEFVEGISLRSIIETHKTLPAQFALRVIRELLMALSALHAKDVIHRDVKPENVLAMFETGASQPPALDQYRQLKLTDFGLARHVEQSESMALTQQRSILGTPLYMAPEQHSESRAVDARADVYAVGATLYHLLSGQPPLVANDVFTLAQLHREERPRALSTLGLNISEGLSNVVAKALEKEPDLRYRDAREMLDDVQRLLAGKPTSLRIFPATPATAAAQIREYCFQWELQAAPANLWPLVADTDRLNRAIGLPAPQFSHEQVGGERRVVAQANFKGMKVRWREHPFQWTRERNLSVLREFEAGPFEWVTSTVELSPLINDRTRLVHRFQVKPRGFFGRLLTPLQFGLLTKRGLDRVYQRLEILAQDNSCRYACRAPFDKPVALTRRQQERLEGRAVTLASHCGVPAANGLSHYLRTVADPTAARIRPAVLAKEIECPLDQALELCFHGVSVGLLKMSWDIICPVCRIATTNVGSIEKISSHASCEFCNLEFEVDFARSVELIFGVHAEIRLVDAGTYCIGGPFHSPHVIAQSRLLQGEKVEIGTELNAGRYQVRGPQLDANWPIEVSAKAIATHLEIELSVPPVATPSLAVGSACICLSNLADTELLVRLEQHSDRDDAVTAAAAARHPLFRQLFPDEVATAKDLVERSVISLLAVWDADSNQTIQQLGEIKMRAAWRAIDERLTNTGAGGCEVIDRSDDYLILAFAQQSDLVRELATLYAHFSQRSDIPRQQFSFAVQRGEMLIGSQSNQSRYFGQTLRDVKNAMEKLKSQPARLLVHQRELQSSELQVVIRELAESTTPESIVGTEFFQFMIKRETD